LLIKYSPRDRHQTLASAVLLYPTVAVAVVVAFLVVIPEGNLLFRQHLRAPRRTATSTATANHFIAEDEASHASSFDRKINIKKLACF
jgi:hypothetical protein